MMDLLTPKGIIVSERVDVRVLITVGDEAEVTTPWHSVDEPLRVPAADIA
jgi:hypothetical protein